MFDLAVVIAARLIKGETITCGPAVVTATTFNYNGQLMIGLDAFEAASMFIKSVGQRYVYANDSI